jgi:hypothetical protein
MLCKLQSRGALLMRYVLYDVAEPFNSTPTAASLYILVFWKDSLKPFKTVAQFSMHQQSAAVHSSSALYAMRKQYHCTVLKPLQQLLRFPLYKHSMHSSFTDCIYTAHLFTVHMYHDTITGLQRSAPAVCVHWASEDYWLDNASKSWTHNEVCCQTTVQPTLLTTAG